SERLLTMHPWTAQRPACTLAVSGGPSTHGGRGATRAQHEDTVAQDPQQQEVRRQWGEVVARAWSDEAYKQRLLSDPKAVLAEAGLPVPANVQVQVHEATPTQLHLVLPPARSELSEAQLAAISAAGGGPDTYGYTWAARR